MAKKGQQVFVSTRKRPKLLFDTGDFVKESSKSFWIKDYETGEVVRYDKSVFKITKVMENKKLKKVV